MLGPSPELTKVNEQLQYAPGLISALTYDGELKLASSQDAEAKASLQRAIEVTETYIREMGAGGQGAARIRKSYQRAYDLLAQLQLKGGQNEDAFSTLGRLQQVRSLAGAAPDFENKPQLRKVAALRKEQNALQQELQERQKVGSNSQPIEQLLADNKVAFYTTLSDLRRSEPQYEKMLAIRPVNFSKLQKFIPADAVVVQYFPAEDGLYIFVVTATDLKIHKVALLSKDLQQLVLDFRRRAVSDFLQALSSGAVPRISWKDDKSTFFQETVLPLKKVLLKLHELLINPIEADIANKKVVAFVPTGILDYLPLQALARPTQDGGVEFLIERKQCVTLLKSSDLDLLSQPPAARTGGMLALGDPDGSLPAADREVAAVSKNFPASHSYVRDQAGRDKLMAIPSNTSYLHLATHGSLNSRDPNSSYLLMAGPEAQSRLSVPQIYDLKLEGLRLVTLSACQTALGESDPGSELTTLADAFSVAGSNSVVASLWSVSDGSTASLMSGFYDGLKNGESLAQALQEAQIQLIHNPATNHPFFWAPFELLGDWR